jgi:hypothetical protein
MTFIRDASTRHCETLGCSRAVMQRILAHHNGKQRAFMVRRCLHAPQDHMSRVPADPVGPTPQLGREAAVQAGLRLEVQGLGQAGCRVEQPLPQSGHLDVPWSCACAGDRGV